MSDPEPSAPTATASESGSDFQYSALPAHSVFYRPPSLEDLDAVHALEAASYPADEAATLDKLRMRIQSCPDLFLLAIDSASDRILGFTCGTATSSDKLTHESMGSHDPEGTMLCIHSVVVAAEARRRGLATRMLQAYLRYVQAMNSDLREIRLISKEQLVKLYEGAGFTLVGPSDVEHGADRWLELRYAIPTDPEPEEGQ